MLARHPEPVAQDEGAVTYAEKLTAEDRTLDLTRPPRENVDVVRALQPHIGARIQLADGTIQLVRGVFDELVRRMEAIGGAIHPSKVPAAISKSAYMKHGHIGVTPFDPEAVKLVAAEPVKHVLGLGIDAYACGCLNDSGKLRCGKT